MFYCVPVCSTTPAYLHPRCVIRITCHIVSPTVLVLVVLYAYQVSHLTFHISLNPLRTVDGFGLPVESNCHCFSWAIQDHPNHHHLTRQVKCWRVNIWNSTPARYVEFGSGGDGYCTARCGWWLYSMKCTGISCRIFGAQNQSWNLNILKRIFELR